MCGDIFWMMTDYRGTTRDIAVYDGNWVDNAEVFQVLTTDAFGHPIWGGSGNYFNFFGFEGKAGGYFNARWYDAANGRFLSEDWIFGTNLYVFCGNDPVNFIDPSGMVVTLGPLSPDIGSVDADGVYHPPQPFGDIPMLNPWLGGDEFNLPPSSLLPPPLSRIPFNPYDPDLKLAPPYDPNPEMLPDIRDGESFEDYALRVHEWRRQVHNDEVMRKQTEEQKKKSQRAEELDRARAEWYKYRLEFTLPQNPSEYQIWNRYGLYFGIPRTEDNIWNSMMKSIPPEYRLPRNTTPNSSSTLYYYPYLNIEIYVT